MTGIPKRLKVMLAALLFLAASWLAPANAQDRSRSHDVPRPQLVTDRTRSDKNALARLERPGRVLFRDGFESEASWDNYFEVDGRRDGRVELVMGSGIAHSGRGCIRFTAPANGGRASGSNAQCWFGPRGYDRIYFRRYVKFAADYDQGNLHHVGGSLAGVTGSNKWGGMGGAGKRPRGDDRFSSSFEPWRAWKRHPAPGAMFLYTYWMDMTRDRDGNYWGNLLGPGKDDQIVLERDRWYCLEHMIRVNDVGKFNGELAAWIDGKLYIHYQGIRWRSSDSVKLKRFTIGIYVHQAAKSNTVWYDDVVLSTGYIGPTGMP